MFIDISCYTTSALRDTRAVKVVTAILVVVVEKIKCGQHDPKININLWIV